MRLFGDLASQCAERGLIALLEPFAMSPVNSYALAADLIERSGHSNAGLNLDALHLFRTGGSVELVSAIEPRLIRYMQISDGLLGPDELPDAEQESLHDRLAPGDGAFPLVRLIGALPPSLPVGIEVPMRRLALKGIDARSRVRPVLEAIRTLLGT